MPESGAVVTYSDLAGEMRKARLLGLLFCEYLNFTADGKANLLGIFDHITASWEGNETQVGLFVFCRTANTEGKVDLRVFRPDGKLCLSASILADRPVVAENEPWHIQGTSYIGFKVDLGGTYWFEISYGDEVLGRAGLFVILPKEGEDVSAEQ